MREWFAKLNRKNLVVAWLLGTFCSCGLMLSLTSEATKQNSHGLDLKNEMLVYVRTLYLSFSSDRLRTFLLLLAVAVVVYLGRQLQGSAKERVLLFLFSGSFALAQLLSMSYKSAGSWDLLFETDVNRTRAWFKGLSLAILCYYVLKILCHFVKTYLVQDAATEAGKVHGAGSAARESGFAVAGAGKVHEAGSAARESGFGETEAGKVLKAGSNTRGNSAGAAWAGDNHRRESVADLSGMPRESVADLSGMLREFVANLSGTLQNWLLRAWEILANEVSARAFWLSVGLTFLCWLPYFVIFYPGTSNEDTVIQMMEFFHIRSYINDMTAAAWADAFITNHHPYLLTLLFGGFIRLGLFLGDIRLGVALYSLLHMLFLACTFSGASLYLKYVGVSRRRVGTVRCLVAFLPIFPLYGICMVKDTIYAAFCLGYILMMYEVARTRGEALKSVKFDTGLFASGLLMTLTKVYAMYILLIVGVAYVLHYRKYALRTVAAVFLPVMLYKFMFVGVLLPALGVAPGGIQEGLSVLIQQTSRYVVEYGGEVTDEERAAIDAVLVYDDIPEDYNSELSDPVKEKWRQEYTREELLELVEAWLKMFFKHPDVYEESLLHNTYQYYDVNKISSLEYYEFNRYLQDEYDVDGEYSWLYVENEERFLEERYVVNQLVLFLQKLPGLNIFMSMGFLPWILWFFIYLYVFRGEGRYVEGLLVPIVTFAVCLVSPDNGNYRYIMPILFALPYLGALVLVRREKLIPEKL